MEFRRRPRLGALSLHRRLVSGNVDRFAALAGDIGGKVHRKAECVVQRKHRFAVDHAAFAVQRDIEDFHAVLERFGEAFLLRLQGIRDLLLCPGQFLVGLAHHGNQVAHQLVEKGLRLPELVAMAQGAADDPPQHVTAPNVCGNDAVHDQEGGGADVVGDYLERGIGEILRPGFAGRRPDEDLEQVDLVVRMHALQHRGHPLQSHAGIDAGLGQRREHALFVPVVLHEHQVPDFDIAVAVRIGRPGRAAGDFRTVVVENFRTGSAGTRVGHLPEVVRTAARIVADAHDALGRHAHLFCPQVIGLVVGFVDAHPQLVLGQLEDFGQQFPGIQDGVVLEIVAERKIAEHLEKRVMPGGIADVLEIVVLAAGAHAALRRGGAGIAARVLAKEHVLELHHARIGEQQRGIVARHERAGRDNGVALGLEVLEELVADVGRFHGDAVGKTARRHSANI